MMKNIIFSTLNNDEYKKLKNFEITYGISGTMLGNCLLGLNNESICFLSLFDEGKENIALDYLNVDWPGAILHEDHERIKPLVNQIFGEKNNNKSIKVLLRGTELQCKVWKELTNIDVGMTTSYSKVAEAVGNPKAIRAVASAIAKNRIGYIIPCHRVIRKEGAPNKYRWGPERKVKILDYEATLKN